MLHPVAARTLIPDRPFGPPWLCCFRRMLIGAVAGGADGSEMGRFPHFEMRRQVGLAQFHPSTTPRDTCKVLHQLSAEECVLVSLPRALSGRCQPRATSALAACAPAPAWVSADALLDLRNRARPSAATRRTRPSGRAAAGGPSNAEVPRSHATRTPPLPARSAATRAALPASGQGSRSTTRWTRAFVRRARASKILW